MSEPEGTVTESDDAAVNQGPPTWSRVVIYAAAALAMLLVGATVGLLLARPELADDRADATTPNAVDIGFSQDMSVHHLQAVRMGNIARDISKDPDVRRMAFDIAMTQQGQVGRMSGWLALWGEPDQATGEPMTWMPHDAHGGHMPTDAAMPGMATGDELRELESLRGKEFDVYFLQLMTRHHQGGAPMAEYAAEHGNVAVLRALAKGMSESQGAELVTMRDMLAERGAKPLPFG